MSSASTTAAEMDRLVRWLFCDCSETAGFRIVETDEPESQELIHGILYRYELIDPDERAVSVQLYCAYRSSDTSGNKRSGYCSGSPRIRIS